MLRFIFAGFLLLSPLPASAGIVTYVFHQTSSSLPGLHFTGQYTIDDSLPFPTVTSDDAVIDFGGLQAFSFQGGGIMQISLADFVPACRSDDCGYYGYPNWSIYPGVVAYNDGGNDYTVDLSGRVQANSDNPDTMCSQSGDCFAEGYWANTVPESSTIALMALAPLLFFMRKKKPLPC
ncbi:MAG: PEP-CTERM sorting domain-containing protein [Alphaproteobacteria bacterium]|nr:PEP-CTERM sorting domain-containing protein [Alphaproteobacteria bacterium]OJU57851.1 MAG: hypothetical protein BGO00_02680 [Alphaproteobacteria bacterium 62-8]